MGINYTKLIGDETKPGFFLAKADFVPNANYYHLMTPWHSNSVAKFCVVWRGDVLKESHADNSHRWFSRFGVFRHGVNEVLRDGPYYQRAASVLIAGFGPNTRTLHSESE